MSESVAAGGVLRTRRALVAVLALLAMPASAQAAPTASFTSAPEPAYPGEKIALHDTSKGSPIIWTWDLDGDGTFGDADGPDVSTSFAQTGTHKVGLQVTDSAKNTDTVYRDLHVVDPPADLVTTADGPDDGIADVREVAWGLDSQAGTATLRVRLRDAASGGDVPAQRADVWAGESGAGLPDVHVEFLRTGASTFRVTVSHTTRATAACLPLSGDSVVSDETGTLHTADGGLVEATVSFPFKPTDGVFSWVDAGVPPGSGDPIDFVPDVAGLPGATGRCDLPGGDADDGLPEAFANGSGYPFAPFDPQFLQLGDDVPLIGMPELPLPKVVAPDPGPPPTARVAVRPGRPRAGRRVVLDASGSTAHGKIVGYEWDLDGDGVAGDATGARVPFAFGTPGRHRVSVRVRDGANHVGIGRLTVAVKAAPTLPLSRAVARARRRPTPTASFDRSLGGWRRVGAAFPRRPVKGRTVPVDRELDVLGRLGGGYAGEAQMPVGQRGRGWISSFAVRGPLSGASPDTHGNLATGALVSPRFRIRRRYLDLRLGGDPGDAPRKHPAERVELWVARGHGRLRPYRTLGVPSTEAMRREQLDLKRVVGSQAVVVAVDASTTGHLNLDDVRPDSRHLGVVPLPPVAGFAAVHEHVMAHQALGALQGIRAYMGVPGGPITKYDQDPSQYNRDVARDDFAGHFGGPLAAFVVGVTEGELEPGDAVSALLSLTNHLEHGPHGGSMHEQAHITDIYRSWQGGMRLMSILVINNQAGEWMMGRVRALQNSHLGEVQTTPDRAELEAQVEATRELVRDNSSWMQIVYSPDQAYDAIAAGKLAVVLGTELDGNGDLGFSSPGDEVDYLWRLGIRQVAPIHAIDNRVGGAAVFQELYNAQEDLFHRPSYASHDVQAIGDLTAGGNLGIDAPDGDRSRPYGYFFKVERRGCDRYPRGECIRWAFDYDQNIVGWNSNGIPFITHPEPKTVPVRDYVDYSHGTGGQRNVLGLTDYGRNYIKALMSHGMTIDLEHMSQHSIEDLVNPGTGDQTRGPVWQARGKRPGCSAAENWTPAVQRCFQDAYPLMSSHTNYRGESLAVTQVKGYTAREFERTPTELEYLRRSGGLIAPVAGQDPADTAPVVSGGGPDVPFYQVRRGFDDVSDRRWANNCAGSSKGWVNAYVYGAEKMRALHVKTPSEPPGAGVALSTDMQFTGSVKPRFDPDGGAQPRSCPGAYAAPDRALEESVHHNLYEREAQRNPIVYGRLDQPAPNLASAGLNTPLRPDVPPGQPASGRLDFNRVGLARFGLLPDLIQDGVQDGMDGRDLYPLMRSANDYVAMWRRAYRVSGCSTGSDADYARCAGGAPTPLDRAKVCFNTCPDDPGYGMDLDPSGRPFPFR